MGYDVVVFVIVVGILCSENCKPLLLLAAIAADIKIFGSEGLAVLVKFHYLAWSDQQSCSPHDLKKCVGIHCPAFFHKDHTIDTIQKGRVSGE